MTFASQDPVELYEHARDSATRYRDYMGTGGTTQQNTPLTMNHWSLISFLEMQDEFKRLYAASESELERKAWRMDMEDILDTHTIKGLHLDMTFEEAAAAFYGERAGRLAQVHKGLGNDPYKGGFWYEVLEALKTPEDAETLDLPAGFEP